MMKWWNVESCWMMKWWNDEINLLKNSCWIMKWWNNEICWMMKWWNSEMLVRIVARHECQNRPPNWWPYVFFRTKIQFWLLNYTLVVSKLSIHNTWAYKTCPHTPSSQKPRGFVNENNWRWTRIRWILKQTSIKIHV